MWGGGGGGGENKGKFLRCIQSPKVNFNGLLCQRQRRIIAYFL
ncbi:hypothetical protein HAL09_14460 [Helicobacter ailurogastricus]|uniref:Uncharacterized protein n=1 Tax=Helicobacter ailurogastricus TaxID=1578720 RepID=A0A0K2XJD9_9HELI|nr:hypothetical protein HAL09_14460 [Helicobacter ailurogastricus]